MGDSWEPEDPPEEAYSRVTNPERFQPLHGFAERLLGDLESEFDVDRLEGDGIDDELNLKDAPSHTVRLVPRSPDGASLAIAFTSFPGLMVRLGRWYVRPVPICGCDACGETAEGEQEHLQRLVEDLISGRFSESIEPRASGDAWVSREFDGSGGGSLIPWDRARARMEPVGGRQRFDYGPWPRRGSLPNADP